MSSLGKQIFILLDIKRKPKKTNQNQTKKYLTVPKKALSVKKLKFNSNEGYRPDHCIDIKFFMIYGTRVNVKLT